MSHQWPSNHGWLLVGNLSPPTYPWMKQHQLWGYANIKHQTEIQRWCGSTTSWSAGDASTRHGRPSLHCIFVGWWPYLTWLFIVSILNHDCLLLLTTVRHHNPYQPSSGSSVPSLTCGNGKVINLHSPFVTAKYPSSSSSSCFNHHDKLWIQRDLKALSYLFWF